MLIDWNAVASGVGSAVLAVYGVVRWAKKHLPQIKKDVAEVKDAVIRLENNKAAGETTVTAEQIATLPANVDPAVRDALLKSLVHDALEALGIEAANVTETYREAIVKYVTAKAPEPFKELVPGALDTLLAAIQAGRADAQAHAAIQAALTLKNPA